MDNRLLNCVRDADLVAKHESRDSGHQLSEEDERQEHGVLGMRQSVGLFTVHTNAGTPTIPDAFTGRVRGLLLDPRLIN